MDWGEVKSRLSDLASSPAARRVFGAERHRFRLAPPLSSAELADAERQFGVRLPEAYRDFLLAAGAGGAGPGLGVFPLVRVSGRWRWEGSGAQLTAVHRLAEPFPAERVPQDQLDILNADFPNADDAEDVWRAWHERVEALWWAEDRTVGAVCICHEGCTMQDWLIISGPHRGTMWSDDRGADVDLAPLLVGDDTPVTFDRWYTDWLDQVARVIPTA